MIAAASVLPLSVITASLPCDISCHFEASRVQHSGLASTK
jgi:hypothetical protein